MDLHVFHKIFKFGNKMDYWMSLLGAPRGRDTFHRRERTWAPPIVLSDADSGHAIGLQLEMI